MMRTAVVGHHEWVQFVRVERLPARGDIVHAQGWWEEPGGGGPGAAVQLHKLSGDTIFFTAFGDDDIGRRAHERLSAMGLRVEAAYRDEPTRRAVTHIEPDGERTITVLGERLHPRREDPLSWDELERVDSVYLTAADVEAVRLARKARVLVATARVLPLLAEAGVQLDALVGSSTDPDETYRTGDLEPPPLMVVRTAGDLGGTFQLAGEHEVRYEPAGIPGPVVDRYGAGDAFAAGLTYGLGRALPPAQAVAFAARCGAAVLTGRGPYEGQITGVSEMG